MHNEDAERCECGRKTGYNGILCENCEAILLALIERLEPQERLYLKEVYYLM